MGFSTFVWCVQLPEGALLVSGVVQFCVWCVEDRGKVAGGPDKREVWVECSQLSRKAGTPAVGNQVVPTLTGPEFGSPGENTVHLVMEKYGSPG